MVSDEKHLLTLPYLLFVISLMASFASPHPLFIHFGENDAFDFVYLFLVDNNYQPWTVVDLGQKF